MPRSGLSSSAAAAGAAALVLLFLALGVPLAAVLAADLRLAAGFAFSGGSSVNAGGGGVRLGDRDSGDGDDWAVVPAVSAGISLAVLSDVTVMGDEGTMKVMSCGECDGEMGVCADEEDESGATRRVLTGLKWDIGNRFVDA